MTAEKFSTPIPLFALAKSPDAIESLSEPRITRLAAASFAPGAHVLIKIGYGFVEGVGGEEVGIPDSEATELVGTL